MDPYWNCRTGGEVGGVERKQSGKQTAGGLAPPGHSEGGGADGPGKSFDSAAEPLNLAQAEAWPSAVALRVVAVDPSIPPVQSRLACNHIVLCVGAATCVRAASPDGCSRHYSASSAAIVGSSSFLSWPTRPNHMVFHRHPLTRRPPPPASTANSPRNMASVPAGPAAAVRPAFYNLLRPPAPWEADEGRGGKRSRSCKATHQSCLAVSPFGLVDRFKIDDK
ncbi:hypothetical protein S40288_11240 [Stachybotrys chartarum IBT 40288]|nr:hypothetical protein S40288_11240 [Stachybotrys chartarum IBT 40288]